MILIMARRDEQVAEFLGKLPKWSFARPTLRTLASEDGSSRRHDTRPRSWSLDG